MDKHDIPQAGFRLGPWSRAAGIGRTTYYGLPPEKQPRSVIVGTCRIITEAPADWLARIAAEQAPARRKRAAA